MPVGRFSLHFSQSSPCNYHFYSMCHQMVSCLLKNIYWQLLYHYGVFGSYPEYLKSTPKLIQDSFLRPWYTLVRSPLHPGSGVQTFGYLGHTKALKGLVWHSDNICETNSVATNYLRSIWDPQKSAFPPSGSQGHNQDFSVEVHFFRGRDKVTCKWVPGAQLGFHLHQKKPRHRTLLPFPGSLRPNKGPYIYCGRSG